MNQKIKNEIKKLIKEYNLNCSINEFQDKVHWWNISKNQTLSEDFIREFQDKVHWYWLSRNQKHLKDILIYIIYKQDNKCTIFPINILPRLN